MRVRHIAGLSVGLVLLLRRRRQPSLKQGAASTPASVDQGEQPSRRLMLDILGQERSHAATATAGLNTFAAALLGFSAVLGVVGLGLKALPNWKGAALASVAASIVVVLVSLADFVFPGKQCFDKPPEKIKKFFPRRPWAMSPEGLAKQFGKPLPKSERVTFTASARAYEHALYYVIKPKKRCLTLAVALLLSALITGGIGVGALAVR
ncbi:hypothetical protein ACFTWM_03335 [Streptomyces bacillaris]|uniref:Uncharacterized protein n=1 Tax=Streptomyces cavourensis TaxID=67258 RepID=A0AAD0Q9A4_9ACTN|nr:MULTISPECIES: hypothetical protein [Streptomyces]AWL85566.1 hypothetical protein DIJ69_06110 [Streptomyces globisporus]AXI74579.1 hypothetical protein DTW94_27280 [Streptomyces cavourensis]